MDLKEGLQSCCEEENYRGPLPVLNRCVDECGFASIDGNQECGGRMRNTQVYLLTLNSPSHKALRLWTGKSLHTLRHCSAKQMSGALVKMQKTLDALKTNMGILKQVKEQFASVSTARVRQTRDQDNGTSKQSAHLADHRNPRMSNDVRTGAMDHSPRRGGFFRNVGQKGSTS